MLLRPSCRSAVSPLLPLLSSKVLKPDVQASVAKSRALFKASKIACWKCGADKPLDNFFCNKCSALQEPNQSSTYFQMLGVDRKFDLKVADLTKKFRSLQNLVHPDKFGNKSQDELQHSETLSALLNQAYKTLLKPLDRGLYLLSLEGMSIEEGTIEMDPAFLMQIMELNEELEAASSSQAILKLAERNAKILDGYTRNIDSAFAEKNLEKAKKLLAEMKYYASLDEKIKELKSKLGLVS